MSETTPLFPIHVEYIDGNGEIKSFNMKDKLSMLEISNFLNSYADKIIDEYSYRPFLKKYCLTNIF